MKIVIVEDEVVVARRLERMTREILSAELESIAVVRTLQEAASMLRNMEDAIVLLDLNLSGEDGFELLYRACAEPFQTIVVSANVDRAIEAFELGVVDFVPKPFTMERLSRALARVVPSPHEQEPRAASMLAVTLAGRVDLIPLASVVAIHGADDYSEIETLDGRSHLHRKTLAGLERLLPPGFVRVHRSHLVNLRFAKAMHSDRGSRHALQLANGTFVPVSRAYVASLRKIEELPPS